MDAMANAFWSLVAIIFLFGLAVFVLVVLTLIRFIKKRRGIKTELGSNILTILIGALAIGVAMSFIPEWGITFALFFCPSYQYLY